MRILLYTQFCTPEPIFFKSVPFACELARRGHEVRILTGFPNYPGGKLFPGYGMRLWQREILDDVPILRTPLFPSHNRSTVGRIANYASFAATSAIPLLGGWRPDVVYVYSLVTMGANAAVNQFLRGVPYVLDVLDLWPDSVLQSGMTFPGITAPLNALTKLAYGRARRVVATTPGIARCLKERGIAVGKTEIIYNWCDEDGLRNDGGTLNSEPEPGMGGRLNLVYAGNLGVMQALDVVIEAAAIVGRTHPHIQFVFMGNGVMADRLRTLAAEAAPRNTLFLPARPLAAAALVLASADAVLMHLRRTPLFEITIPSKAQAYLAMGRPILCALAGDAADLINRAGGGVTCEPENPAAIAAAAIRLAELPRDEREAMGARGREFYHRELSLKIGVGRFEAIFQEVIAEAAAR